MPAGTSIHSHREANDRRRPCNVICGSPALSHAAYLKDRKPHWGERHYKDHEDLAHAGGEDRKRSKEKTIPGPLHELMGEKLSDLSSERLERWASKEAANRPARARLALRLVKAFLKWCATMPDYAEAAKADAASSKRVREKLGTAQKRDAVLRKEQLPAWFREVRAIPNPVISAYLQFMLLAGPRPNEPLGIKWSDVNFQWSTVTIRDKIEGTRQIGLTPYLSSLLIALPRRNQWVFSSPTSASGKLIEPAGAHDAVQAVCTVTVLRWSLARLAISAAVASARTSRGSRPLSMMACSLRASSLAPSCLAPALLLNCHTSMLPMVIRKSRPLNRD